MSGSSAGISDPEPSLLELSDISIYPGIPAEKAFLPPGAARLWSWNLGLDGPGLVDVDVGLVRGCGRGFGLGFGLGFDLGFGPRLDVDEPAADVGLPLFAPDVPLAPYTR